MDIIGIKEVMDMLGISRQAATRILNLPGCPVLPRSKNQIFRVLKQPFLEWLASGSFRDSMEG